MLCWIHRFTPLVLSLMVAGTTYADSQTDNKKPMAPIQAKIKRVNDIASPKEQAVLQRNLSIAQRTNDIFTLLASELINIQGKSDIALATNMKILKRTQDPALAERLMEIALGANKIEVAEEIAQNWQTIDPKDSADKQRLLWELALAKNDVPQLLKYMDSTLSTANEYQLRRMFLLLAQFRLKNLNATDELNQPIHNTAIAHPDMVEAMIADAIYGVTGAHKAQTMKALQQLSVLDNDIIPATQLTLNLINIKQPQYLVEFYRQAGMNNLSARWQTLYIEILIKNNQLQEAYLTLQPLLAKSKSADLYLQAIYLALSQRQSTDTIVSYAQKAVELGNQNQRSKAAMLAAMRFYDEHNFTKTRSWLKHVTDPTYKFDQAILMASVESDEKRWTLAKNWLNKAQAAQNQTTFFDPSDLVRLRTFINSSSLTPQQYEIQLTKDLAQAEKSEASQRETNLPPLLYLRGLLYADKLNQPAKAVKDLRRYVVMRPNQADGLNALGYTMLSMPKSYWKEAQDLLERAYQMDSQSPAINDSLGWVYHLNGTSEKGLPLLEYAYTNQPESEVAAHLGEVYWQLDQKEKALQIWAQGLSAQQSDHQVLQKILKQHGIKPASLTTTRNSVSKVEVNNKALLGKVLAGYFNNVSEETFLGNVNKLMLSGSAKQRNITAIMTASWYYQQEKRDDAIKWLEKISDNEMLADKAYLMGMIAVDNGNYAVAQQWLQQLKQHQDSLTVFDKLNITILTIEIDRKTLSTQAYIQKLTEMLDQAEKNSEDRIAAMIIYMRGSAYFIQLHQYKAAIADYRIYVQRSPEDAIGWNDLGYALLYMPKKHWSEALRILQHAYKLNSDSAVIKDSLGWAYYLNGDVNKAIPFLRSAYNDLPVATVAAHLGEVLWQQGQRQEARQIWAQGLGNKEGDSGELMRTLKKFAIMPEELLELPN